MPSRSRNPETTAKPIRARAYVRVSHVGKREGALLSDEMQLSEAKRYAAFEGLALDEEASRTGADLDVSGFKKPWRQRPGLMRHYEAAKRGEFDCLVFYKISRLARNVREALDMIDAFEKVGVSFHFVAERIDSGSAQGRFLRNVLLAAAEMQSEDMGAFLRSTFLKRAMDGKAHGAVPGWLRKEADGSVFEIPGQVAAMRRLVELRVQGNGQTAIARKLNDEGHRAAEGGYWTQYKVAKYLRRDWIETMRGTAFFGRGKEDAVRIPGAFPAILSETEADTLIAINELYSEEYRRSGRTPWAQNRPKGHDGRFSANGHLLSGIVWCPRCGCRMVAWACSDPHKKGQKRTIYTCPHYNTQRLIHPKNTGSVIAYSLEDAVLRVVRHVLAEPPEPVGSATPKPATAERRLPDIRRRIDKLVEMNLRGRLSDEDFSRHYDALLTERDRLQTVLNAPQDALKTRIYELGTLAHPAPEELRQLVLAVVERIEANVVVDGILIRKGRNQRRFARVVLRFPVADGVTSFLSPLHTSQFRGERRVLPEN